MIFKNGKIYDVLKWCSGVFVPAFGVLYSVLSAEWNLPFGEQILKTCTAIAVFGDTLLGVSSIQYAKMQKLNQQSLSAEDKE